MIQCTSLSLQISIYVKLMLFSLQTIANIDAFYNEMGTDNLLLLVPGSYCRQLAWN
jgi:hypothetical protein